MLRRIVSQVMYDSSKHTNLLSVVNLFYTLATCGHVYNACIIVSILGVVYDLHVLSHSFLVHYVHMNKLLGIVYQIMVEVCFEI